jgi:hypothetical protein
MDSKNINSEKGSKNAKQAKKDEITKKLAELKNKYKSILDRAKSFQTGNGDPAELDRFIEETTKEIESHSNAKRYANFSDSDEDDTEVFERNARPTKRRRLASTDLPQFWEDESR